MPSSEGFEADVLVLAPSKAACEALLAQGDLFESVRNIQDSGGASCYGLNFGEKGSMNKSVFLAHLEHMNAEQAKAAVAKWLKISQPRLLALTGLCTGHPQKTALGDLCLASHIIPEHGRVTGQDQSALAARGGLPVSWWRTAMALDGSWSEALRENRPLSFRAQEHWLLSQILVGENLIAVPEREWRCPDYNKVVSRLMDGGLIDPKGALTELGRKRVQPSPLLLPEPEVDPEEPKCVVGPMLLSHDPSAKRDAFWQNVEDEVAAIALSAVREAVLATITQPVLLVQGVVDQGAGNENPAFRAYAEQAVARFLLRLLPLLNPNAPAEFG